MRVPSRLPKAQALVLRMARFAGHAKLGILNPCQINPSSGSSSSREDLRNFPASARRKAGLELRALQRGASPTDIKPMATVGPGAMEIRLGQSRYREMIRDRQINEEDLGFDIEEAANLKVRADLMIDLRNFIEAKGWTQSEAAAFFGETQPRISNLMSGEIARFSVDKLIVMLTRAGMQIDILVTPQAA